MLPLLILPALAFASADLLAAWSARTGLDLTANPGANAQDTPDGLALVGSGESLLFAEGTGSGAADGALAKMWAPFVATGIAAPTPTDVACRIGDRDATCRGATLAVAPGANLHLLAGQPEGADWLLVCLDRDLARPGPCSGRIVRTP